MKKKLLITGASGLLGLALTNTIAEQSDFEIYAVTTGRQPICFPAKVHKIVADILDPEQRQSLMEMVQPTHMFHLAWGLEDASFLKAKSNVLWLEASLHLLRLFIQYGGKRLVFAGSSAEYGYGNRTCKENGPVNPQDLYGAAKLSFTQMAKIFCEYNQVEYVTMRFFSIYGINDDRPGTLIPTAIQKFSRGESILCKAPNNVWDYIYVEDAVNAAVAIMNHSFCGIINVASGKPHRIKDVFTTIAKQMHTENLLVCNDANTAKEMLVADTTLLETVIGYQCRIDFESGIGTTIQWWKDKMEKETLSITNARGKTVFYK